MNFLILSDMFEKLVETSTKQYKNQPISVLVGRILTHSETTT